MIARKFTDGRYVPLVCVTVLVLLLPSVFPSGYYYRIGALVFIFALAAVGLNLLMGFAGQVSLGHAGFMGIGAYMAAIGPAYLHIPAWLCILAGAGISGVVAFVVGRPILRLSGHYLAVVTLGYGLLISIALTNEAAWTGGPDGMSVQRLVVFSWPVRGSEIWYWISAATLILGMALAFNLVDSPTGRALQAIHDS
jgi:branched-chain amino acid transport system permease protein